GGRVARDAGGPPLRGRAACPAGGGGREGAVRHAPFSAGIAIGSIAALMALLVHSAYDFPGHIPANGVLAAACLGIATVALHTRFTVSGTRSLVVIGGYPLESRRLRRVVQFLIVLLAIPAAEWIVRPAIVSTILHAPRATADPGGALRRADIVVGYDDGNERAREVRGQLRLATALDVWNVGATPDARVLQSWAERRELA